MSIARCRFATLAIVASLSVLALACAGNDQPLGVPDAAQNNFERAEASTGFDAGSGDADAGSPVQSAEADGSVVFDADDVQSGLEGYWDLVVRYSAFMGITTQVPSGSSVVHFKDGVAAHYLDNCGNKICSLKLYSLQGTNLVFAGGNADALVVTDTTLRMTTLQAGGLFDNLPGDTLDFVRLATFSPDGYAACQ